ncbi:MAG: YciK family oxidoreductase [Ectothiorhodospiraceae bacterium]|nr:YciK family oxidoreductase [Ectothiorhodospiraceae bacterium]
MSAVPADYQPRADLLAGRTVLITGAGDGIGRAVAEACAAHGATVVLLGRTVRKLERVYDAIVDAGHPEPAIYPMDLLGAAPTHHEELAQRVDSELGRLDGLLHNAGILGPMTAIERYDPDQWARVFQVNVHAAFLLSRACLPLMRRTGDASMVFTSSGVGRHGRAYWGAYACSKFAIEGLSQVLADEVQNEGRVRSNCISPGPVRTAMRAAAFPGEDPQRLLTPREVVIPYLYLLGPDSRGLNGASVDAQSR